MNAPRFLAVLAWAFCVLAWLHDEPNRHLEAAAVCAAASWLAWLTRGHR